MQKTSTLVMAPIRGITDCHFRSIFHNHFPEFDRALAPFINPQRYSSFQAKQLKDLLPEANMALSVTPQLLHTSSDDFLFLAERLFEMGYQEINWNLGCPAPMVTRKKRGSGLLPHTGEILQFLDIVLKDLPTKLSIKTRLGFQSSEELLRLLPELDNYPLSEIIIHGRLGVQMYKGKVDLENFARCLERSRHNIVYNGDITDVSDLENLEQCFPDITRWMIGRGILANPFLAGEIKGIYRKNRMERLHAFHNDLFRHYRELLDGPSHLLGRMKQLWFYLSEMFPPAPKTWKKIKKCRTEEQYLKTISELF